MTHTLRRRFIQHKRSSVPGNMPTPEQLVPGELAINFADRCIYTLTDDDEVVQLTGHAAVGLPATAEDGDAYIDPDTGKLYVFYTLTGSGGSTWNEVAPSENLLALLPFTGESMLGPLEVVAPAVDDELVGFDQASEIVAEVLALHVRADGTVPMTGPLELSADPVSATDAATKGYADDAAAAAAPDLTTILPRTGGTMTGQITLKGGSTGNQAITVNELAGAFAGHEGQPAPHTHLVLESVLATHKTLGGSQHAIAEDDAHGFMSGPDKLRFDGVLPASEAETTEGLNNVKYITPQRLTQKVAAAIPIQTRGILTGNVTFYVRDDGNDFNSGLVDSNVGAFRTWQAAVLAAAVYDFNGFAVTIKCTQTATTFTAGAIIPPIVGLTQPGNLLIQGKVSSGDPTTIIDTNAGYGFRAYGGMCRVEGFKFQVDSVSGNCAALSAANDGNLEQRTNHFGAQTAPAGALNAHLLAEYGGHIHTVGDYEILEPAPSSSVGIPNNHMIAHSRGLITTTANNVNLAVYADFPLFALAMAQGVIDHSPDVDWDGDLSLGDRYLVASKAVIVSQNNFPTHSGDTGDTTSGGVYVDVGD